MTMKMSWDSSNGIATQSNAKATTAIIGPSILAPCNLALKARRNSAIVPATEERIMLNFVQNMFCIQGVLQSTEWFNIKSQHGLNGCPVQGSCVLKRDA
mmetsp:Transcript_41744/g.129298  ORF Transcript_41744/g.129298 Transcript_41744/m.129298 type:complete len:99 (+) Transcript_41744:146-442(+)